MKAASDTLPSGSLSGAFIVGHPASLPRMKTLCDLAGFQVAGNTLAYKGTTIDLTKGAALAIVDLPGGGRAGIGLGQTKMPPNLGRARLGLVDDYGRMVRGLTEPKTTGPLVFKL
jgi:hypothetical protein